MLYHKGVPILIDTGNETYNKETFGPNRYSIWVNRSDYHNLPMPMGMTQSAGREYRADYFTCENGVCETEFSSAYPMDVKCTRKMTVTEERVTVATFVSTEATHVFMTAICPVIAGNTVTVGQVKMHFSEKVGITLEEIPLADPQLRRGWRQDRLYRLLVTAGELTVTFTEV